MIAAPATCEKKIYIPQKKAKNMYNTDSKRKSIISCKKIIIFEISDIFFKGGALWCQNC